MSEKSSKNDIQKHLSAGKEVIQQIFQEFVSELDGNDETSEKLDKNDTRKKSIQ
jgi:hypothetical protein